VAQRQAADDLRHFRESVHAKLGLRLAAWASSRSSRRVARNELVLVRGARNDTFIFYRRLTPTRTKEATRGPLVVPTHRFLSIST
jgi:hypothetical protein